MVDNKFVDNCILFRQRLTEDGPRSLDISNVFKNNFKMHVRDTFILPFEISCLPLPSDMSFTRVKIQLFCTKKKISNFVLGLPEKDKCVLVLIEKNTVHA